jgi:hypothetical protein
MDAAPGASGTELLHLLGTIAARSRDFRPAFARSRMDSRWNAFHASD